MTTDCAILVVDDDVDIRESIIDALSDGSYRAVGASNGRDALRVLRDENFRPHLILLDMMMPEMDGREFRAEQRKDPAIADIPVVVFTAYGVPSDAVKELHAAGFLKKPLRLADLLSMLARFCPHSAD